MTHLQSSTRDAGRRVRHKLHGHARAYTPGDPSLQTSPVAGGAEGEKEGWVREFLVLVGGVAGLGGVCLMIRESEIVAFFSCQCIFH